MRHSSRSDNHVAVIFRGFLSLMVLIGTFVALAGGPEPAEAAPAPVTITLSSQETLWLDANKCGADGPRGAWLSFIIKNTSASPLTNVVVSFAGFTGTNAAYFVPPSDLVRQFGVLAAGGQKPVYFYVDYSEVCNHPQGGGSPYTGYTANYTLSATASGFTPVVRSGTITTNELITANAAGVAELVTLGPGVYVGQLLTQTVRYSFGNNSDLFFQPAGEGGFDDACIRLVQSRITAVSGTVPASLIGQADRLHFPLASTGGSGGTIDVTYTWEILCVNQVQVVHPWAAAKSGQKFKYTGFAATTIGMATFPPAVEALTISKSVVPSYLSSNTGGPVTWSVTFTNASSVPLVLGSITDVIPGCMSIANPSAPGSDITAGNSSAIPLVGATGTVSWVGIALGEGASTYQVPASSSITLKYTTNLAGCPFPASYANSATGMLGSTTVGPATATLDIGVVKSLLLEKTVQEPTYAAAGSVLHYTYVVTNTGTVALPGPITVSDNRATVTCPVLPGGGLAPGASTICTATYTVTQADVDAGSVTNTATASGNGVTSNQDSATSIALQAPALAIVKAAQESSFSAAGEVLHYTYVVTNTGNVTLAGPFTISDDKATDEGCPSVASLVPGESITCTATYTVTQANLDAGSVTNTATATNGTVTSPPDTETVPAVQSPHLTIVKSSVDMSFDEVGDVLHYTYVVTNTGNVTLAGPFTVSDDRATDEGCPWTASLAPGEFVTCTATYTVTQADLDAGYVTNTATATNGTVTSPPDTYTIPPQINRGLTIVKTAAEASFAAVGDVLHYTYVVTNTGNVFLPGPFSIDDDKATDENCPSTESLAPGQHITCTATYTVTQADLDAGYVTNVATATNGTVTSEPDVETVPGVSTPALAVVKTVQETSFAAVGDVLHYTYVVTNTGNVTLAGPFSIEDDKATDEGCPSTASLAPGDHIVCAATYTVTQADLDAGSATNVAYATNGTVISEPDTVSVPAAAVPGLTIVKTVQETSFAVVGNVLHYTYVVTNTGNVTLTGPFSIEDDKATDEGCPWTASLAPGEHIVCAATYTVTQADLGAGYVTNVATATNGTVTSEPDTATVEKEKPVAVELAYFTADQDDDEIVLRWKVMEATDDAGFLIYREGADRNRTQVTAGLLSGKTEYEFRDKVPEEPRVDYWLQEVGRGGDLRWHGPVTLKVTRVTPVLSLAQNWPNPFDQSTTIAFRVPREGMVTLRILDLAGREVSRPFRRQVSPGRYVVAWDGRDSRGRLVSAGVYFYQLSTPAGTLNRKLLFMR